MENKIKEVIANILMLDINLINDDSSPETIESWDSMNQMNIVVALEEEFNIRISDEDVIEMLNIKLINSIISEYLTENKL